MNEDAFTTPVQVRFRDLDPMKHVNNGVYMTYLELARAEYFRAVLGEELQDIPTVLATITIDFRHEITREDDVEVAIAVPELGESSIPMVYEIRASGELAAEAESILVHTGDDGRSAPMPEAWREGIEAYEGL